MMGFLYGVRNVGIWHRDIQLKLRIATLQNVTPITKVQLFGLQIIPRCT